MSYQAYEASYLARENGTSQLIYDNDYDNQVDIYSNDKINDLYNQSLYILKQIKKNRFQLNESNYIELCNILKEIYTLL